jgi:sulfite dehydrogenase
MFAKGRSVLTFAIFAALLPGVTNLASGNSGGPSSSATSAVGAGKQLFLSGTTPSCATCHALKDAGANGNVGPDLDALRPSAARVERAVRDGFEAMPAFGAVLSQQQIAAIARYVEQASGNR